MTKITIVLNDEKNCLDLALKEFVVQYSVLKPKESDLFMLRSDIISHCLDELAAMLEKIEKENKNE